jgi:hypothetical protein
VSAAASPSSARQRAERDRWNDYALLRFDGIPGGPIIGPDLVGSVRGHSVGIEVANRYLAVDELPPNIATDVREEIPYYLGVNKEYVAFGLQDHAEDIQSGALVKRTSEVAYVYDRVERRWSTMKLEGTCSRSRIFGSWLATIVQFWDPTHAANPGASDERSAETDTLPNVRALYAMFAGRNCRIPGILLLGNLGTEQRVAFNTGKEDSEIVGMHGATVLYRVNGEIFQAKIDGESLKDTELIVKDENAPEIHWAFWSE